MFLKSATDTGSESGQESPQAPALGLKEPCVLHSSTPAAAVVLTKDLRRTVYLDGVGRGRYPMSWLPGFRLVSWFELIYPYHKTQIFHHLFL